MALCAELGELLAPEKLEGPSTSLLWELFWILTAWK